MSPDMWADIQRLNQWMNANTTYCEVFWCGGAEAVTTTVHGSHACQDCADKVAERHDRR
jgi:hypothetical protein